MGGVPFVDDDIHRLGHGCCQPLGVGGLRLIGHEEHGAWAEAGDVAAQEDTYLFVFVTGA